MARLALIAAAFVFAAAASSSAAALKAFPKRLSTTYKLPMWDGVELNTIVDEPPFFPAGKKVPAILERSPCESNRHPPFSSVLHFHLRGTHRRRGENVLLLWISALICTISLMNPWFDKYTECYPPNASVD